MILVVDTNTYQVDRRTFEAIIKTVKDSGKNRIVCVEKEGYAEMLNERYYSIPKLRAAIKKYEGMGWIVHHT